MLGHQELKEHREEEHREHQIQVVHRKHFRGEGSLATALADFIHVRLPHKKTQTTVWVLLKINKNYFSSQMALGTI